MSGLRNVIVAGLLGTAVAIPSNLNHQKRDEWKNDAEGGIKNVEVYSDDTKVQWGDIDPVAVVGRLGSECNEAGCEATITDTTWILKEGENEPTEFELTLEVQYNYPGWARAGLTDIHNALIEELMKTDGAVEDVQYQADSCGDVIWGTGCQPTDESIRQHKAPKRINVRQTDEDMQLAWNVQLEEVPEEEGNCETIIGIGETLAGVIPGKAGEVGGTAFGLAGIFC